MDLRDPGDVATLTGPALCLVWCIGFSVDGIAAIVALTRKHSVLDLEPLVSRYGLSTREEEVADLLVKGKRYHEIGEVLSISKATVTTYVFRVYSKLGINSKIELIQMLLSGPTM